MEAVMMSFHWISLLSGWGKKTFDFFLFRTSHGIYQIPGCGTEPFGM